MSYSVYIKYKSKRYKLPVNPEEIKKKQKLNIEKYQVLGSGQVSVPTYQAPRLSAFSRSTGMSSV